MTSSMPFYLLEDPPMCQIFCLRSWNTSCVICTTVGVQQRKMSTSYVQGRNRHIFLRGQSHFSWFFPGEKCFFPVEIPILVDPKQISVVFNFPKWKAKKKKRSSPLFITFPTSNSNFTPSLLQFFVFFLNFCHSFLFSLPLFPDTSAKISQSKVSGGHPACYATAYVRLC